MLLLIYTFNLLGRDMSHHQPPPYNPSYGGYFGPPPAAPPSYAEASGGVPPSSPFQPQPIHHKQPTSIVTTVVPLGPQPTHMICPHCHVEIESSTKRKPGIIAYLSGIALCAIGCFWGCCLVPCCIDSCMDVHHTCPYCNAYLGRYRL
ncbi:lipopolysaccharide-induced tumor necrosis factor-alpha factor homolog isoform X2 [Cimex lectularius]|uniref:LITAF domain-containing protein n=1 Tax=Cimex lectularius TaxID=79782 RepID=A0A8I6S072_CIMLE|nr:lipopolysaccharide-induced tumor necrosis factor-alpha factor homolog isoform X2 [Cimex lectularius]